jgi:hypothetical protein
MTSEESRRQAREKILRALQRLKVPRQEWPMPLQLPPRPPNRQLLSTDPFRPPPFDRLSQTINDWAKEANEAWDKHLAAQVKRFEFWESTGIDPSIEEAKRSRGARKPTSRRRGLTVDQRFEAAALRLVGEKWETITATLNGTTGDSLKVNLSAVKKAATAVLETAGWPDKESIVFPRKKYHLSGGAETIVYDSDQEHRLEEADPGSWSDKPPTPVETLKFRIKHRLQYRAEQRHKHGATLPLPH